MNGITFSGDSPIISGTWQNPKTGDKFTVRDTYFEDNNFVVVATDGRRFNYDLIQQYVQTPNGVDLKPQQTSAQPTTAEPQQLLENPYLEEDTTLTNHLVANTTSVTKTTTVQPKEEMDEDVLLITRLLKRSEVPSINCSVNWKHFPIKQMDMLNMMAVDPEKICDFYMKQIDLEVIRANISTQLTKIIEEKLKQCDEETVIETSKPVSAPVAKHVVSMPSTKVIKNAPLKKTKK